MTFDEFVAHAVAHCQTAKEQIVADAGVGEDLRAFVMAPVSPDGFIGSVHLTGDTSTWPEQVRDTIGWLRPSMVAICGESYTSDQLELDDAQAGHGGDAKPLRALFAAGDRRVVEALFVAAGDITTMSLATVGYRYMGRRIDWSAPTVEHATFAAPSDPLSGARGPGAGPDGSFTGFVPAAVRAAFSRTPGEPDVAAMMAGIHRHRAVAVLPADYVTTLPGRNDLCPCGSSRKAKHCHWR
jgi:hypothetical protein